MFASVRAKIIVAKHATCQEHIKDCNNDLILKSLLFTIKSRQQLFFSCPGSVSAAIIVMIYSFFFYVGPIYNTKLGDFVFLTVYFIFLAFAYLFEKM